MGLVASRRRVGLTVQPRTSWQVFDPRVIRWRLDSEDRLAQLQSLGELRKGLEPVAAGLAAERATPEQCGALSEAAGQMVVHGRSGDPRRSSPRMSRSTGSCSRRAATRCSPPWATWWPRSSAVAPTTT
jgi:DNA-binding FadR family transcriptional regulator